MDAGREQRRGREAPRQGGGGTLKEHCPGELVGWGKGGIERESLEVRGWASLKPLPPVTLSLAVYLANERRIIWMTHQDWLADPTAIKAS